MNSFGSNSSAPPAATILMKLSFIDAFQVLAALVKVLLVSESDVNPSGTAMLAEINLAAAVFSTLVIRR